MPRIEWNLAGERFFETGIDRTVLYPNVGVGVPWNGVVSVSEVTSGGEMQALYYDGNKYLDLSASEDFQATLEAYSSPAEFAPSDGQKALSPGLFVGQQPRKTFGLCYRTLKGNDLVGPDYGYKLHLVYNCTAAPSGRLNSTINASATPDTRAWTIYTVPPPASTFKPTAHLVLDSTLLDPAHLATIEDWLYGTEGPHSGGSPALPSISLIVDLVTGA
jgi:hypothetical protein